MIVKKIASFLILFTFFVVKCENQNCFTTKTVWFTAWESYTKQQVEQYVSYEYGCYYYGCYRTRWQVVNDVRQATRSNIESTPDCCPGYTETERNSSNINCQPICTPGCQNGYCRAPGECECNQGYVSDQHDHRNCTPSCPKGTCEHGICIAPNTCQCNFGYTMVNSTCQPICTDPCHNGTCVGPETCECLQGYRKSNNNTCEPYCSSGCENGTCAGPENCRCNPGFDKVNSNNSFTNQSCAPVCTDPCGNGTCVSPDTCECFSGYEWNSTCIPRCTDGCAGGDCVSPDVCRCETGWEYKNGTCVPKCNYSCGNGSCVLPNVCRCFIGYHLDVNKLIIGNMEGDLCIPSCVNCSGSCVAPNTCVVEVNTTESHDFYDDEDFVNGTTIDDVLPTYVDGYTATSNGTDTTILFIDTTDEPDAQVTLWIQQHWAVITFPVLLIVIIALATVIALRWRFLRHYFKGQSYTIQGNVADAHRTSSFADVSFSDLDKRDGMAYKSTLS